MTADASPNTAGGTALKGRSAVQRGFARHSVILAPMTVKNIAIAIVIAAQPMTWIVAIARFETLERISHLSTGSTFETRWSYLYWPLVERIP
jgi:hypothetical protein